MKTDKIKKISTVFLILAITMILFFTLQDRTASYEQTEKIRIWLCDHGLDLEYGELRTNAHLVEYFIVGVALAMFVKARGWNIMIAVIVGCTFGVIDETVKIYLAGREFGTGDLIRDFIGVVVAAAVVAVCIKVISDKRVSLCD